MNIQGFIKGYDGEVLIIVAPFSNDYILTKQGITDCEIRLVDGRRIGAEQRKHIYATMRDISLWSGYEADELKALMKYEFIAKTGCEYFSLSDTDMTTAREFQNFLVEFCLEHQIPTMDNLIEHSPDTSRYLYACLMNKTCAVCGISGKWKVQLHHVDRVGIGRDRKEIIHKKMSVLSLCGKHHNEAHSLSVSEFENKYKVYGIKADDEICSIYKLKSE